MSSAALRLDHDGTESFADELPVGTRLLQGQFTIESFLNTGGFGITYVARDSLNRQVVIKECFPSSFCRRSGQRVAARSQQRNADLRSMVGLFMQEAINLSKLDHPNIVRVHQVFQDNDTAYMAMDYIRGPDLLETVEGTAPRLAPDRIVLLLGRMLDALGHVHAQGFLHRDISPDNILLDSGTGEPVLIDFGAARKDETRKSRAVSGLRVVKDGYSPQEFYISGSLQAPCSDLYALAASFSHLITGEAPKTSRERLSAIASRQADPQLPLLGRVKGYPAAFLAAIDKAMAIFPRDRLQSVAEWQAMLDGQEPVAPSVQGRAAPAVAKAAGSAAPAVDAAATSAVPAQPLPPQRDRLVRAAAFVVLLAGLASLAGEIYDRFWAPKRDALLQIEGALPRADSGVVASGFAMESALRPGPPAPERIGSLSTGTSGPGPVAVSLSPAARPTLKATGIGLGDPVPFPVAGLDPGSLDRPAAPTALPITTASRRFGHYCFDANGLNQVSDRCPSPLTVSLAQDSSTGPAKPPTSSQAFAVAFPQDLKFAAIKPDRLPADEVNNAVATCDFAVQRSVAARFGACFRIAATYRGAWISQDGLEKLT